MGISFTGAGDSCIATFCNKICPAITYSFFFLNNGRFHSSNLFAKLKKESEETKNILSLRITLAEKNVLFHKGK